MKLYIANCSKQVLDFTYRAPEQERLMSQLIPSGQQIQIYKDATKQELEYIILQHERYGLVPASEIDREVAFIGACYSFDKHINIDQVMSAAEHNDEALRRQGLEIRKQSAASLNDVLNRETQGGVASFEMEVRQELRPGDNAENPMAETIEVVSETSGRRSRRNRS